jgi:hypothetical protein
MTDSVVCVYVCAVPTRFHSTWLFLGKGVLTHNPDPKSKEQSPRVK